MVRVTETSPMSFVFMACAPFGVGGEPTTSAGSSIKFSQANFISPPFRTRW